ncbi:hypothetical protein BD410DRAFT_717805 [Rickenella mellea]|uniref:Uncharacterized protein n=1 Tax=Rickenella mellea TaxID=50990 RepID=A0A4Y7QCE2_9AGAM|nr:hypothetical protein BD410DRAFT_717805 [Rickenella mellea]
MSSSFLPPGESSADLWFERSSLSGEVLGAVAYGVHATIFAETVYFMTQKNSRGYTTMFLLAFVCALFTLGTIFIGANTKLMQQAFIDNPGGPIAWLHLHYDNPVPVLGNTAYIIANFLADGVLLHRLLVVWEYNYFVVVIPILGYLGSTALSILTLFQSARPGANLWTHTTTIFAIPYWSLSLSVNLLVTLMIVLRIILWRNKVKKTLGPEHSRTYTSVAAMLIESAAPYSVVGLIYIICYARTSNFQHLVLPVLAQIMCISPELIILRVSLGRAWSKNTTSILIGGNSQNPTPGTGVLSTRISFAERTSVSGTTNTMDLGAGSDLKVDRIGSQKAAEVV